MRRRTIAASGARLAGFKLHFRHDAAVLEQVLCDAGQRIVLLCRRDKLGQWASYLTARETGQWAAPRHASRSPSTPRIRFRMRRFLVYLVHQHTLERQILARRPDCLRIYYEDIVPPGSLSPVLSYLGVDAGARIVARSRRQFTGRSSLERFDNPKGAAVGAPVARVLARALILLGAATPIRRLYDY